MSEDPSDDDNAPLINHGNGVNGTVTVRPCPNPRNTTTNTNTTTSHNS